MSLLPYFLKFIVHKHLYAKNTLLYYFEGNCPFETFFIIQETSPTVRGKKGKVRSGRFAEWRKFQGPKFFRVEKYLRVKEFLGIHKILFVFICFFFKISESEKAVRYRSCYDISLPDENFRKTFSPRYCHLRPF